MSTASNNQNVFFIALFAIAIIAIVAALMSNNSNSVGQAYAIKSPGTGEGEVINAVCSAKTANGCSCSSTTSCTKNGAGSVSCDRGMQTETCTDSGSTCECKYNPVFKD